MRRANIRAQQVYKHAPREYIGTGTESRNYIMLVLGLNILFVNQYGLQESTYEHE